MITNLSLYEQRKLIRECSIVLRSVNNKFCGKCQIKQELIHIQPSLEELFAWIK